MTLAGCAAERGAHDEDAGADGSDASSDVPLGRDGIETVEAEDTTATADATDPGETVDAADDLDTVDAADPVETDDQTDSLETTDAGDSTETSADIAETSEDTVETADVEDAADAVAATAELVVRIADDVNQDGFITPLDALLLINGAAGGVVGAEVSVFDTSDVLVTTGLTAANPSPLVLVLAAGCYRVDAGDRADPLLSTGAVDGLLCIPAGGRESATFLDVAAGVDDG